MRSCALFNVVVVVGLSVLGWSASCEPKGSQKSVPPAVSPTPAAASTTAAPVAGSDEVRLAPPRDMVAVLDELLIGLEPCGELACATFEEAKRALNVLLDAHPRILAVGETHVLKGKEDVVSATERFETQLLPELARRGTSELVVELLKPAPECQAPVEQVEQKEKQVTEQQAPENKNRFVSLGVAARKLDIVPYLLEPDCAAYRSIAQAGEDAVLRMLEVIRSETERRVERFFRRQDALRAEGAPPKLVVAYGGALHNDIDVEPAKEKFAFGKRLVELSGGRYLELDLIVPEFIRDDDVWRKLPWYASFDRSRPQRETTLIRTGPRSFVLIFGHGAAAVPEAATSAAQPR